MLLLHVILYGLCAGKTLRRDLLRRFFGERCWPHATRKHSQQCFQKILRTVPIGIYLGARCGCVGVLAVVLFQHLPFPTHRSRARPGALHARGLLRSRLFPGKL